MPQSVLSYTPSCTAQYLGRYCPVPQSVLSCVSDRTVLYLSLYCPVPQSALAYTSALVCHLLGVAMPLPPVAPAPRSPAAPVSPFPRCLRSSVALLKTSPILCSTAAYASCAPPLSSCVASASIFAFSNSFSASPQQPRLRGLAFCSSFLPSLLPA